jgi:hypothetical protein
MKFSPKWATILIVDTLLIGGMVLSGYFVIRYMFFSSASDPDYLMILLFGSVVIFSMVNMLYMQYRQLNTVFTEKELIRPKMFGDKHYKWTELVSVTIKVHELVIMFQTGNVRLMLQLYSNSDELLVFINDRYRSMKPNDTG